MSDAREVELANIVERGLAAVEALELDRAEEAMDDASKMAGENHARVLHLAGMIAWAHGDIERATGFLMQAADLGPDRADIYLDAAECVFTAGDDLDEAEAAVRVALELPGIESRQADEARLLLAQIRLAADDAEEALEILGTIAEDLRGHPAYLSTLGATLLSAGQPDQAVVALHQAVQREPDDPDFHYQLAVTLDAAGEGPQARKAMVRVLELDLARAREDADEEDDGEPDFAEIQTLRSALEDVLEDLPDPLLRLVSSAPITVQRRATAEQVETGIDPRASMGFAGTPKRDDDSDAELDGIVIMRDLLLEELEDVDELPSAMFYGLLEELRRFFRRDDIALAISSDG